MKRTTLYPLSLVSGLLVLILVYYLAAAQPELEPVTLTPQAYTPILMHQPTPTPTATPTAIPSLVDAWLGITLSGDINASTFAPGSFVLTNRVASYWPLTEIQIDLRTAALPDIVFDPYGTAGDVLAKDLEIDSDPGVGFIGHDFSSPNSGGFDVLRLVFNNFDPGETLTFSIDVDPTSIRGVPAPGPNDTGSVSGLEMSGATITATFANGMIITQQLYRTPGSDGGAEATLREHLLPVPTTQVVGVTPPVIVNNANQTVQVNGAAFQQVRVLILEGGLFTAGLPGGGHDIDPFEANSVIAIQELTGQLDSSGQLTLPVVLTQSHPDGGINHLLVVFEDAYGIRGRVAGPFVLDLN